MEALNSTAIKVSWKPPLQGKQHGQIRGYQVIFSRLENGEPRGQPNILDIALPEAQVTGPAPSLPRSAVHALVPPSSLHPVWISAFCFHRRMGGASAVSDPQTPPPVC